MLGAVEVIEHLDFQPRCDRAGVRNSLDWLCHEEEHPAEFIAHADCGESYPVCAKYKYTIEVVYPSWGSRGIYCSSCRRIGLHILFEPLGKS